MFVLKILPDLFAFFGAKIGALSISYYYPLFCPNFFPLKLIVLPNFFALFGAFSITYHKGISLNFLPFLEPK
jgi:hypothetical protein